MTEQKRYSIAQLQSKFAVVDTTKAVMDATGGEGGAFLRIKKDDRDHVLRFLPPLERADGSVPPSILSVRWHYIPGSGPKVVPCLSMLNKTCPLCEFDREAKELIGYDKPGSRGKSYEGVLPSSKYGVGASQRFLTVVMERTTDADTGGFVWTGPHILEMPIMMMQKIFGLAWKGGSMDAALASKLPDLFDIFNEGAAVKVRALPAPEFFSVSIDSDRSGKYRTGPLFAGDDAEDRLNEVFAKMPDLGNIVKWPDHSVYDDAVAILRREMDEIAGTTELPGDVVEARTAMSRRTQARPALPTAQTVLEDDDEDVEVIAPRKSGRAATQTFDMDDDI